jgi:hypothetical protein
MTIEQLSQRNEAYIPSCGFGMRNIPSSEENIGILKVNKSSDRILTILE